MTEKAPDSFDWMDLEEARYHVALMEKNARLHGVSVEERLNQVEELHGHDTMRRLYQKAKDVIRQYDCAPDAGKDSCQSK